MSRWHDALSLRIRERVLRHYLVPYSHVGLDAGLVPHLPRRTAVTLVDIGAHRGEFTAAVEAHCGIRKAVLVEPQPSLQLALEERFVGDRFHVCNDALSDHSGAQAFEILAADSCSSLLQVKAETGFRDRQIDVSVKERREVRLSTLDEVMARRPWDDPIDVLKVDTQGTELDVLRGATGTLLRVRYLWIEVSFRSLYEGDALFPEIHGFLSGRGFRFFSLHDVFRAADRELLQADALFLGPMAP